MAADEFDLVFGFMRQDHVFVLGFEIGRFWELCDWCRTAKGGNFEFSYHTQNEGEILRVANHFGVVRSDWHTAGQFHHGTFFR